MLGSILQGRAGPQHRGPSVPNVTRVKNEKPCSRSAHSLGFLGSFEKCFEGELQGWGGLEECKRGHRPNVGVRGSSIGVLTSALGAGVGERAQGALWVEGSGDAKAAPVPRVISPPGTCR